MQVPSLVASCLAFFIDNDSDHEGIASTVHHQISASQVTNYCTKDDHCYHNLMVAYNDWRFTVVDTGNFYDANWYHNLLVWFWIQKEVLHEGDTGNSNNANSFPNFETPTMLELLHLVLLAIIWIITISPPFFGHGQCDISKFGIARNTFYESWWLLYSQSSRDGQWWNFSCWCRWT